MTDEHFHDCPRCGAPIKSNLWMITDDTIAMDGTFECKNCHAVLRLQHECFINDDGDCDEWIEEVANEDDPEASPTQPAT